jgi:methionyl-tRNA formyltransferase
MATPEFAVPPLRRLVEEGYDVVAVVTSPDRPAGRGLHLQQSAVKQYAVSVGLPVLQPVKLRDEQFVRQFEELRADLGIVIAFRMLPEVIWSNPALGTFNLHASLLPQYRGAAPINRAVMNGETQTGLTTFMLNAGMDKGAILGRRTVDIAPDDTAGTLHDRLRDLGPQLVIETIAAIASGVVEPIVQDDIDESTLKPAPKIFPQDCRIDWTQPGEQIRNLVRGLSPYPGAWSELSRPGAENVQVKVFSARFIPTLPDCEPGTIRTDGKSTLEVACADGYMAIEQLRPAGKKSMIAAEFLRGVRDPKSLTGMR